MSGGVISDLRSETLSTDCHLKLIKQHTINDQKIAFAHPLGSFLYIYQIGIVVIGISWHAAVFLCCKRGRNIIQINLNTLQVTNVMHFPR